MEGVAPSLHLSVVAMEKGAFGSPSHKVAILTFFYISFLDFSLQSPQPDNSSRKYIFLVQR